MIFYTNQKICFKKVFLLEMLSVVILTWRDLVTMLFMKQLQNYWPLLPGPLVLGAESFNFLHL